MLYFDHNATTPLAAPAREAWLRASTEHWQNPSSLYHDAGYAAQQLDAARERLADLLGTEAERIVFTGSATEANNALFASLPTGSRVLISAIEHPSVREAARHWCGAGNVIEAPVDEHGIVQLGDLLDQHQPSVVSVMAANNESGVLQPWHDLQTQCRQRGIAFHTDASQWIGKQPSTDLGHCDYMVGCAHKFGGPKGVGFLLLRDEAEPLRFLRGGPQEHGRRAGTENYPSIEAMVTALEHAQIGEPTHRDAFEQQLLQAMPNVRIISAGAARLWNTSLVVMPRHSNLKWLTRLSRRGIAISTGSACSSGKEGSSVVMRALGASEEELRRVLRFSSGAHTSAADWQQLLIALIEVDHELAHG